MHISKKPYVGIDTDTAGGMTVAGRIIRDAWAVGIVPETETCEGCNTQRLEGLCNQTHAEREQYGHSVSQLPEDTREHDMRIQWEAFDNARQPGR